MEQIKNEQKENYNPYEIKIGREANLADVVSYFASNNHLNFLVTDDFDIFLSYEPHFLIERGNGVKEKYAGYFREKERKVKIDFHPNSKTKNVEKQQIEDKIFKWLKINDLYSK